MILYVDINDFIVDDVQKNLLAHAMIATGVVVITENYLFRDIRNYGILILVFPELPIIFCRW